METERMLIQLREVLEKEKGAHYGTCATQWDRLLEDVIAKIEELSGKHHDYANRLQNIVCITENATSKSTWYTMSYASSMLGHIKEIALGDSLDNGAITPSKYVEQAMRTAQLDVRSPRELLDNAALGLSGESGEFADHVKKFLYHGHELDNDYMTKELGDILWYIALAASTIGVPLEGIMQQNIDKLLKRYPGKGFDPEKSINREQEV